jgi:dolichol-phosphate mannosyltransferase
MEAALIRPLVIVPTFDERENLAPLLEQLLQIEGLRILIVDDSSPDGTGQIADEWAAANRARVQVLHRSGRRGLGLSYIDGMYVALRTDATHILQMDADLSHNPADIPRLLAATTNAEFAIGSRYVPGGRIENWPARRRMLSAFANRYIRAITKLEIRDCTSGFRCWRREALERLPLASIRSDGYAFIVELVWEASRGRFRCCEVPITFVERRKGASKLTGRVIVESAILPWRLAARPK